MSITINSTKNVDLGKKLCLHQALSVPECLAVDMDDLTLTNVVIPAAGGYAPVELVDGRLQSTVLPDLVIDLAAVFRDLPSEAAS
jgi:hypothetical protein